MNFIKLILFVSICFLTTNIKAQLNKSISFELAGLAGLYSLNYDNTTFSKINYRIGISVLPPISYVTNNTVAVVPLSVTKLFEVSPVSHLEFGAGTSLIFFENSEYNYISSIIGLRGQDKFGEGTFYKLTAYPSFRFNHKLEVFITAGLTIGKSF